MCPRTATVPESELCQEVIEAAFGRFLQFGYHKTTMAEIADDIGMSAANLYRYFENKQDIAAACCIKSMTERLARLRGVVDSPGSFAARLERYAMTMIEHTHELSSPDSRIGELVAFITRERIDVVQEKLTIHYELIADMLEKAQCDGEISCSDIEVTAKSIYSAFVVFDVPLFVGIYSIDEYKARARGIVELITKGLLVDR